MNECEYCDGEGCPDCGPSIVEGIDEVEDLLAEEARTCRVCGCTNFDGCAGGCTWVEPDLCSRCAQPHRSPIVPRQVA